MISSTCMTLVVTKKVLSSPSSSGRKPLKSINPVIHPATRRNTMGYTGIGSWIPKKKHGRFAMSGTGNDRISHRYEYPYLLSCGLTGTRKKNPQSIRIFEESFSISIITRIELLGWKGHSPEGLIMARHLLDCARCISLTDTIAEKTIEIRNAASITLPDAVIAASALSLDAVPRDPKRQGLCKC